MSYIDNVFRQHGSVLYKKSPRSIKCWQRVLETLNSYQKKVNGHGIYDDIVIIGNPEVTIDSTNELDQFISDNIYDLTSINRDISGNWKTVKEALEMYAFGLLSNEQMPDCVSNYL